MATAQDLNSATHFPFWFLSPESTGHCGSVAFISTIFSNLNEIFFELVSVKHMAFILFWYYRRRSRGQVYQCDDCYLRLQVCAILCSNYCVSRELECVSVCVCNFSCAMNTVSKQRNEGENHWRDVNMGQFRNRQHASAIKMSSHLKCLDNAMVFSLGINLRTKIDLNATQNSPVINATCPVCHIRVTRIFHRSI